MGAFRFDKDPDSLARNRRNWNIYGKRGVGDNEVIIMRPDGAHTLLPVPDPSMDWILAFDKADGTVKWIARHAWCCPCAAVQNCPIQFGQSGSFVAGGNGQIYLSMNDDYFPDNTGGSSLTITINGVDYVVLCDGTITNGPVLVSGETYTYTCPGTWSYDGTDFVSADGNGTAAPGGAWPAPGLSEFSVVGLCSPP